ncbi:MAG: thiamine phosphate synthase [Acidimicrobiales bacterium]|nr:thiamine phosphate synthase [Acidimicrobiales bacterium]
MSTIAGANLYLCTSAMGGLSPLLEFVEQCIKGGVDIVQLRDKDITDDEIIRYGRQLSDLCHEYKVPFILNDRPDLVAETLADGLHVGQDDMSVAECRKIIGDKMILGLSTHQESELVEASGKEINYLSVGPVVPTPTKPGRPGTGLDYVRFSAEKIGNSIPFFITGGVSPDTIPELYENGARRFVVVRYLTQSDAPQKNARLLKDAIKRAQEIDEELKLDSA